MKNLLVVIMVLCLFASFIFASTPAVAGFVYKADTTGEIIGKAGEGVLVRWYRGIYPGGTYLGQGYTDENSWYEIGLAGIAAEGWYYVIATDYGWFGINSYYHNGGYHSYQRDIIMTLSGKATRKIKSNVKITPVYSPKEKEKK